MFTIGIGRMYVDGLLAECHGLKPLVFDPILGELDGILQFPTCSTQIEGQPLLNQAQRGDGQVQLLDILSRPPSRSTRIDCR